jgi:hypothetical protein
MLRFLKMKAGGQCTPKQLVVKAVKLMQANAGGSNPLI